MMKEQEIRKADELAKSIREALDAFKQICKKKNKPVNPCDGCPLWMICGTIPGSVGDETIGEVALDASEFLILQKEVKDE